MNAKKLALENKELLIKMRRHLHEYPELSGEEIKTVAYISQMLTQFQVKHVVVENGGVLGFIEGGKKGKTILLRADCDALPLQECPQNTKQNKTCVSKVDGVHHACGHDVHTACLLTVGKILEENKAELYGNVVLCFERGEEGGTNNLFYLFKYIEDNQIEIDGAWGLHINGEDRGGLIALAPGPFMAGNFFFNFTLEGLGGHGARPDCAVNPIQCFHAIQSGVDSLRMCHIDPYQPATITICSVSAGSKDNIIPDTLSFGGNARFYHRDKVGSVMRQRLLEIVESCTKLYGCKVIRQEVSQPSYEVINQETCFQIAWEAFEKEFGKENLKLSEPMMGSETFAFISQKYPSMFGFFGVVNEEKGITVGVHNPQFDVDEDCIHGAVAMTLAYTEAFLQNQRPITFEPFVGTAKELYANVGRNM